MSEMAILRQLTRGSGPNLRTFIDLSYRQS
jgi:hypothetical protein